MAISIEWATGIISVPKADLTLIQATPTEIREMDLDWFRLQLKALEADAPGIGFLRTHNHNTEVSLGGLTFARVIEIINGYTVTFEDGQYAVNLVGANSNVGDVVNVNQVSVRSQNSAGLISTPLIEFSSFLGGVWVMENSGNSGTIFPTGTAQEPVDNLSDAKLIAEYRGFNKIYPRGAIIVDSGLDYSGFVFEGDTQVHDSVDISSPADVSETVFRNLHITGTLDGDNEILRCIVEDLLYINGFIQESGLLGDIQLGGNANAHFNNCYCVDQNDPPVIDMGGAGQNAIFPDWSGKMRVKNLTGATNYLGVGLDAGRIILENTVTSGIINVSGTGRLVDESGDDIPSGIWNGGVTIINELSTPSTIAEAVWEKEEALALFGLVGENVKWSSLVHNGDGLMTSATITLYETSSLVTPVKSWDITATYNIDGELTDYQMVEQ